MNAKTTKSRRGMSSTARRTCPRVAALRPLVFAAAPVEGITNRQSFRGRSGAGAVARRGGPPALAASGPALADGPDLAAVALRALARAARRVAPARPRVSRARGVGRVGVARDDAVSRRGLASARRAASAVAVELLRVELPYLCASRRPAGHLVLQPRCVESRRRGSSAAYLPVAVPPRAHRCPRLQVRRKPTRGRRVIRRDLPSRRSGCA